MASYSFASVDNVIHLPAKLTAIASDDVNYHVANERVRWRLETDIKEGRGVDSYLKPAVYVGDDLGMVHRIDLESDSVTHSLSTSSSAAITTITLGSVRAMSQGGASLNRSVYCGSSNGNIYVWYYSSDELGRIMIPEIHMEVFVGHKAPIIAIECVWLDIFEKESVVSIDEDGTLIVWELTGDIAHRFQGIRGARSLSADRVRIADSTDPNPKDITVMVGCKEGVRAWKICRGFAWEANNGAGKFVDQHSAVEVFGTEEKAKTEKPFISSEGGITAIQFETFKDSKRNLWAVIGSQVLCLQRNSKWTPGTILLHDQMVEQMMINESWGVVITSSVDNKVRIWDAESGVLLHNLSIESGLSGLTVVDLDKWKGVVGCGDDGKILRWSCTPKNSN